MNHIDELKDYLIADEIIRIESLSLEQLRAELIELNSKAIEQLSDREVLNLN